MIGACLTTSEKPNEALLPFQRSIEQARSFADKAPAIAMRAEALEKTGDVNRAVKEPGEALNESPDDRAVLEDLWAALANAYKTQKKLELRAAALHRVAELAGNDAAKWFRAAYAYSEAGEEHLAIPILHCYRKCIFFDSNYQYAKNNIGVLLQQRNLPILAVSYFKEDADRKTTLSMGNLAETYLRAGFAADAEELLTEAEALPEPDEKVARVRADVSSARTEESKKLEGLTEAGSQVGQFLTRHIRARNLVSSELGNAWTQDGNEVEAEASDFDFSASWSVSSYRGGRRFKGTLTGLALTGSFEAEGASWGGVPSWTGDGTGYGIVSDDGRKIECLKLKPEEAEYVRLSAVSPS